MGYWGLRPLLMCTFVVVLVVACTDDNDITPTPDVTLTVHPTNRQMTAAPGLPTTIQMAPKQHDPITCYATGSDGVLCLGSITNDTQDPLTHIVIRVDILQDDGTPFDTIYTTPPQQVIPPGAQAPYRALFNYADSRSPIDYFAGVEANVIQAEPTKTSSHTPLQWIKTNENIEDDLYLLSGVLRNASEQDIYNIRLIATLFDDANRVLGFRVQDLPHIEAGEERAIQFDLMPQATNSAISYKLAIESMD